MTPAGNYDLAAVQGEPCRILLCLYDAAADGTSTSEPLDVRPSNFRGSVSYGPKMAADDLPDPIRFRASDPNMAADDLPDPIRFRASDPNMAVTVPAMATPGRFSYAVQFRASASDAWETLLSGALEVAPSVAP